MLSEERRKEIHNTNVKSGSCGGCQDVADLLAENERLRDALTHIEEYWNRDNNETAMFDALWHMVEAAQEALSAPAEVCEWTRVSPCLWATGCKKGMRKSASDDENPLDEGEQFCPFCGKPIKVKKGGE